MSADGVPPSLRLIMKLTDALRASGLLVLEHCSGNETAMQRLAINDELLAVTEPAIQKALNSIEDEPNND